MDRLLVVGDIHGYKVELEKVLKAAKYDPDRDGIVFIGDYIDRGPDSYGVYRLVRNIIDSSDIAVALLGNHEDLMIKTTASHSKEDEELWHVNGSHPTKESFHRANKNLIEAATWFQQLPLVYETENYVFVHGGINPDKGRAEQLRDDILWLRPNEYLQGLVKSEWVGSRKLIVGHTPTLVLKKGVIVPIVTDNCIFIDTGVHCGGRLSLYDLTNDVVYQAGGKP